MRTLAAASVLVAFGFLPASATAQVTPGAGSILQQTQPVTPPVPSSSGTGLTIEGQDGAPLPNSAPFLVSAIQLSGNIRIATTTLHALVADVEGRTSTLPELAVAVARISKYYRSHGYPLARAIIPAQSIKDGVVRIEIVEARYGEISLDNHSRVADPVLRATLSSLESGQTITQAALDHTLLLLSDIPGADVLATLKPGEAVGTSDLQIAAAATPAVAGNVTLDNYGNRYTGRARAQGSVSLIDPLHRGDVLSLTGLTSGDVNYGSLGYELLLDSRGTRLGGSFSALHYILGSGLRSLDAHGIADVGSLWLKHPLVRTPDVNVYGQIQFDHKRLDDRIGASDIRDNRHLDDWTLSLYGDLRDALLSGGINTWSVGATTGRVGFDNDTAEIADAATVRTRGRFLIWNGVFSRLQRLSQTNSLSLTISGQTANSNVDPAEKMIAGGAYTVRAYDMGVLSGDSGIVGTAELRHDLALLFRGPVQVVAFVDAQRVTVNHDTWIAGPNAATLKGAGFGITWAGAGQWRVRAYIAAPVGSTPGLTGTNSSARVWGEISKGL